MISSDDLKTYIAEVGYRTLSEIKEKFASENPEILSLTMSYLTTRNQIKQIKYQKSKEENEELFYIPF
jgi:hypothetical protein